MALKNANILRATDNLPSLDLNHLPLDDKTVFQLLKNANTTAVFQLESRGMKDMLKQIVAIGNDVYKNGSKHTGSILLETMSIASS